MNFQNLFSGSNSLSLTKSSKSTLNSGYWNLSTSEYETENSTKCNTSTRDRGRDIVNEQSNIQKKWG